MCIICNCGDAGDTFLTASAAAGAAMKRSVMAMAECRRVAATAEQKQRYDAVHKRMVKLLRDWNRLEQEREYHGSPEMTRLKDAV